MYDEKLFLPLGNNISKKYGFHNTDSEVTDSLQGTEIARKIRDDEKGGRAHIYIIGKLRQHSSSNKSLCRIDQFLTHSAVCGVIPACFQRRTGTRTSRSSRRWGGAAASSRREMTWTTRTS